MSAVNTLKARLQRPMAILFGGCSAEREISLRSGTQVMRAMEAAGVPVLAIDTADAEWFGQLAQCDMAFIALHGPGGEDGTLQGALEILEVPYTGSGVLGSALAMDKLRSKYLWQGLNLPTPGFVCLSADSDWAAIIAEFGELVVKPAMEGSSLGMSRVETAEELETAWKVAAEYGAAVLAEQWVTGDEYSVSLLGESVLPAIRLEVPGGFYDFDAKYRSDKTRYHCPCGLDAQSEADLAVLVREAFDALGCAEWGRIDVMRDASGQFWLLEANTVPGLTDHSLVPMAAAAAGIDFPELLARIALMALEDAVDG